MSEIDIKSFDYNDIGRAYDFKSPLPEGEYFALELTSPVPPGAVLLLMKIQGYVLVIYMDFPGSMMFMTQPESI
ncbi:hypothetical protein [Morganella morganii]|uniref:hypothetical protein n=1 Tax=Morganella morganii TaxID=582 RepID=UPI001FFCB97F|nr:hypothetical protein [Morganella morganii]